MGSSLKMPRGSLSLLHMQTVPLAMCGIAHSTRTKILTHSTRMSRIRNSSPPAFHPDVSHPEFFSADIPPGCLTSGILSDQRSTLSGCLTSGILLRRHSTRMSRIWNSVRSTFYFIRMFHIRNSSPPTFHPDTSHPEFFSTDIPPGCLTSGILSGQRSTLSGCLTSGSEGQFLSTS